VQPQLPPLAVVRHIAPRLEVEQSMHAPPASPHELVAVPATQLPLEQQPPLHTCDAEQVVVHWCLEKSHA
jgi:hypothetical protein